MSMPSLSTAGGIFLLYPAMRAAKVLGRPDRAYVVNMLNKIAEDVPVASSLADHLLELEMLGDDPTQWLCNPSSMTMIFGEKWAILNGSSVKNLR